MLLDTILKLALSAGILGAMVTALVGGGYALRRVWTSRVNVEGLPAYVQHKMEDRVPTVLRDNDSLYQAGQPVGRVVGVTIDQVKRLIHFDHINDATINFLDPRPEPVIFQRYRVHCRTITNMTGQGPYTYDDVTCEIAGDA